MQLSRMVLAVAIGFLLFLPWNLLTYRFLLRFHPSRARRIRAIALVGNLMWLVLPFVLGRRTNAAVRVARALLAPPWFTWLMFILLYSAFLAVVALFWIAFRRWHRMSFTAFGRWPSVIALTLLCSMAAIGYVQAIVPFRVERIPVTVASLPAEASGYRIALISDLHVGLFTRRSRLREIRRAVEAERPDLVLIAGDLIDDDPAYVPKMLDGFEDLPAAIPLLAVLGNHEIYGDPHEVIRKLDGSRIRLLVNEGTLVAPRLWIAGLSEFAADDRRGPSLAPDLAPDLGRALRGKPPDAMPILVAHQPRAFALARQERIPLTLAAHTHGGQFGFRPVGWSLAGVFLPYDMGLYERDGLQLYINTGTGYWVVPLRFGMEPTLTIIELKR